MIDIGSHITGMQWHAGRLWLTGVQPTTPPLNLARDPFFLPVQRRRVAIAGGGRLGQQLLLWSPETRMMRRFDCPDGAASGATMVNGKLWLSHRRNRKLSAWTDEKPVDHPYGAPDPQSNFAR